MSYHTPFIGREREIAILQSEWEAAQARMLILYGRRRVGKTRLVTHWINKVTPRALYWVAGSTSSLDQLRSFSQALFGFESIPLYLMISPMHRGLKLLSRQRGWQKMSALPWYWMSLPI